MDSKMGNSGRIRKGITVIIMAAFLATGVHTRMGHSASTDTDELLRKIGISYIKKTLDQSANIEEAAKNMGIESSELKILCTALKIKVPFPEEEKQPKIEPVKTTPVSAAPSKLGDNDYAPDVILDYNGQSPYLILVDKEAHQVYLLQYKNGKRSIVQTFECKTGKNQGDKRKEGDNRTPEGAFFFVNKYSRAEILKMVGKNEAYKYGDMAFVTDFPNSIDRVHGKDGGGIWLHGTDKTFDETSPYDTRGCVVVSNKDIKTISDYIELYKTPIVIVDNLNIVDKKNVDVNRDGVLSMIESWRKAWEKKDIDDYQAYYASSFTSQGMSKKEWLVRKKGIFRTYDIKYVKFENYSIFRHNSGMVVQFVQDYSADNISKNVGIKTLYLMPEGNSWKIIMEHFRKL